MKMYQENHIITSVAQGNDMGTDVHFFVRVAGIEHRAYHLQNRILGYLRNRRAGTRVEGWLCGLHADLIAKSLTSCLEMF